MPCKSLLIKYKENEEEEGREGRVGGKGDIIKTEKAGSRPKKPQDS